MSKIDMEENDQMFQRYLLVRLFIRDASKCLSVIIFQVLDPMKSLNFYCNIILIGNLFYLYLHGRKAFMIDLSEQLKLFMKDIRKIKAEF